jgi:CHAT domain-containing protein
MAFVRSPSLHDLRRPAAAPHRARRLLALGDPRSGAPPTVALPAERSDELGPLPEARREVHELAELYGDDAVALVGEQATERAFKERAEAATVLHLATHGLLEDRAPLYSALLLAAHEGDGEDGLLEVREIAELRLGARLAVLSACETAGGTIRPGEGVIGLWWALLAAGVPVAVVSDWSVDSAATAELMVRLHRELLAGVAPAEALRRAQLAVRALPGYSHPYYWAAFGVLGAGFDPVVPAQGTAGASRSASRALDSASCAASGDDGSSRARPASSTAASRSRPASHNASPAASREPVARAAATSAAAAGAATRKAAGGTGGCG